MANEATEAQLLICQLLKIHTLTNGWSSTGSKPDRPQEESVLKRNRTTNAIPLTKTGASPSLVPPVVLHPSSADWSSSSAAEGGTREAATRRQSSRTAWSAAGREAELREREMESGRGEEGERRSLLKREEIDWRWREGSGRRGGSRWCEEVEEGSIFFVWVISCFGFTILFSARLPWAVGPSFLIITKEKFMFTSLTVEAQTRILRFRLGVIMGRVAGDPI
jgi:hypothetical protein